MNDLPGHISNNCNMWGKKSTGIVSGFQTRGGMNSTEISSIEQNKDQCIKVTVNQKYESFINY